MRFFESPCDCIGDRSSTDFGQAVRRPVRGDVQDGVQRYGLRVHSFIQERPRPVDKQTEDIDLDVTKPCDFIGFGALDGTKPYEFIGFGALDGTKPYEFIGFEARFPSRQATRRPANNTITAAERLIVQRLSNRCG